eukprot:TRINITY_DN286_c1_g1_i1.p1 TRINITY_DN286_c1_g1~~TRINITY_DN286_c1_g1_i1.p1  ORF type:complete len:1217 (-),score=447.82 TRINITY_DN286_c1_g1_i1:89-3739(-)
MAPPAIATKEKTWKTKEDANVEAAKWTVARGQTLWVPSPDVAFKTSLVYEVTDDEVETEDGKFNKSEVFPVNPKSQDGVSDNTMLMYLYDPNLLHNLKFRYDCDSIYTYTAYILIAINPYKRLPIYDTDAIKRYHTGSMGSLPPHVFGIAERAFRHMRAQKKSQSIIVSGDSGAGKTESCKYILRYLTNIAGRDEGQGALEQQILEANPVLEAFGNAKTMRNINSSRFGKFIEVHFDTESRVAGAKISTYLLEKSRLVFQMKGERNFHIFYQLIKGSSAEEKERWNLDGDLTDFHYLNQSGCDSIDGVDDVAEFEHVRKAMGVCGISSDEQEEIFKVLSALLHLGNVEFTNHTGTAQEENSRITDESADALDTACALLQCDKATMAHSLTTRTMRASTRGTMYTIPLKVPEAVAARDALAKQIFSKLFDWLVSKINSGIPRVADTATFIGILDISGFEHFQQNGFDQFLINYCNERIQQYFTSQVIDAEQYMYLQEGLRWRKVDYTDNSATLALIDERGKGIFPILEEQLVLSRADDCTFTEQVHKRQVGHKSLMSPTDKSPTIQGLFKRFRMDEAFVVRHFAADVCYATDGFLEKNNDTLHNDLIMLMRTSGSKFVEELFVDSGVVGRSRHATITNRFYDGLTSLMTRLKSTCSNFIRCINPNPEQVPGKINSPLVMQQLRCSGMLEALRIMAAGFPTRCYFTDLYNKYKEFVPKEIASLKPAIFCEALLVCLDLVGGKDFQMGLSRVFFRAGQLAFMDDLIAGNPEQMANILGKVKLWLARKRWRQAIFAVVAGGRFNGILEYNREQLRLKDEEKMRASEAYQAEMRRRAEEERKRLEEERRKKEEEARIKREAEEARRQEKLAKKRAHEEEVRRLRMEAAEKLTLEAQVEEQRKTFKQAETDMLEDIDNLENELHTAKDAAAKLESQYMEEQTQREMVQQRSDWQEEEIARLRERIAELEDELEAARKKIDLLQNTLDAERADHQEEVRMLQDDLLELARQRDEEVAAAQNERDIAIANMKEQMAREIERVKAEAEKTFRLMNDEKNKVVTQLEEKKVVEIERVEKLSTAPMKSGWLFKRGGGRRSASWKKRYFVLKSGFLRYYKVDPHTQEGQNITPAGVIDLESALVYKSEDKKKHTGKDFPFEIVVTGRTYVVKSELESDRDEWIRSIRLAKGRIIRTGVVDLNEVSVRDYQRQSLQIKAPPKASSKKTK